jgi:hypothetical protein
MRKLIGLSLGLVCAMVLPIQASLLSLDTQNRSTLVTDSLPVVSQTESPVQKVSLGSLAENDEMSAPSQNLILTLNSSGLRQGNPLASTELRINLDNFDMEYVLKVQ